MGEVEVQLRSGRPKDLTIRAEVLTAIAELHLANIETIRRRVSERLGVGSGKSGVRIPEILAT